MLEKWPMTKHVDLVMDVQKRPGNGLVLSALSVFGYWV